MTTELILPSLTLGFIPVQPCWLWELLLIYTTGKESRIRPSSCFINVQSHVLCWGKNEDDSSCRRHSSPTLSPHTDLKSISSSKAIWIWIGEIIAKNILAFDLKDWRGEYRLHHGSQWLQRYKPGRIYWKSWKRGCDHVSITPVINWQSWSITEVDRTMYVREEHSHDYIVGPGTIYQLYWWVRNQCMNVCNALLS